LNRKIVYDVNEKNFKKMMDFGIRKMVIDYGTYLDEWLIKGKKDSTSFP